MPDLTREGRIKKELKRLKRIFAPLPQNERDFVKPLIENAAFMAITLEDLQAEINDYGCIDEYQNGENQKGVKQSASTQAYVAVMKTYNTTMDKLLAKLPKDVGKNALAKFMESTE